MVPDRIQTERVLEHGGFLPSGFAEQIGEGAQLPAQSVHFPVGQAQAAAERIVAPGGGACRHHDGVGGQPLHIRRVPGEKRRMQQDVVKSQRFLRIVAVQVAGRQQEQIVLLDREPLIIDEVIALALYNHIDLIKIVDVHTGPVIRLVKGPGQNFRRVGEKVTAVPMPNRRVGKLIGDHDGISPLKHRYKNRQRAS